MNKYTIIFLVIILILVILWLVITGFLASLLVQYLLVVVIWFTITIHGALMKIVTQRLEGKRVQRRLKQGGLE